MKQVKQLSSSALPLAASLLLIIGMVGCTCAPVAPPASPTELPADTAVPTTPAGDSPWKTVLQINVEQPTRMAAFLNEQVGFTGGEGDAGTPHYTTDGGQTWTPAQDGGG